MVTTKKIRYNTKFHKGTLELVVGDVDITQLLEKGGYEKGGQKIISSFV
jgi:hypothetical protein